MGPGQYSPSTTQTKQKPFTFKIRRGDVGATDKREFQERLKVMKFEGIGATIRKPANTLKETLKSIEERMDVPVFGAEETGLKAISSFQSTIKRENKLLVDSNNPSPDAYSPIISPKFMIKGR
jgi:hypothetical protein